MKVELIEWTGRGIDDKYAAAKTMVFTKQTRLQMTPTLRSEIDSWPEEKIYEELMYMADTIPSSWEFCDYTFLVSDCNRAFTHQLVRTRQGSYAQQTMRVLDVSGFGYDTGPTIEEGTANKAIYDDVMAHIQEAYDELIANKVSIEDARGMLPTNIHTNIVCKFNLRTLSEVVAKRSSSRTQGHYREFLEKIVECVLEVHPWAILFLDNRKIRAAAVLESFISDQFDRGHISGVVKTHLIKQVDMLRG